MSRKTSGPKKPKNGANGGRQASSGADNGAEDSKIIRLTATPALPWSICWPATGPWLDLVTDRGRMVKLAAGLAIAGGR